MNRKPHKPDKNLNFKIEYKNGIFLNFNCLTIRAMFKYFTPTLFNF
jgi:hypothetical protein